eukprot:g27366.t1
MLLPMGNFLTLNFFAQRYTDLPPSEIKCQISSLAVSGTMSPYCQMALVDGNRLLTVLALVMPLCQFLTLPLVGLLSDAYGRKKALFVVFCLSNVALVFADLFIFFNVSFWFVIAWQPFMNTQVCTTVLNAACVDLLRPQDRAAGMGIISALDTIAYVIGLLLGYHLEMKQTYIVATFATLITGFVLVVFFPETLPPEKRSFQLSARNFVPWDSMPILWRTKTLRCLADRGLSVFTVSGSIGSLLGGFMFEKLGNVDENGQFSRIFELGQAMVVVNLVGAFLSAFLFYEPGRIQFQHVLLLHCAEIAVNPSGGFGKAPLSLNFQCRHVRRMLSINSGGFAGRLHWAVLNADGAWQAPAVQPDGSQDCDGTASSAHLNGDGNVTMTFRSGQVPEKITFVLVIEVGGQTHWLNPVRSPGGENFVVDVAALAAEVGGGGLGGEARVAPREPTWPELEKAKAAVASAAKSDTSAPVVRRRRAKAPAMVNSSDLFVKAGEMQVEQGLGSIKWTATVGADEVNVFLEA